MWARPRPAFLLSADCVLCAGQHSNRACAAQAKGPDRPQAQLRPKRKSRQASVEKNRSDNVSYSLSQLFIQHGQEEEDAVGDNFGHADERYALKTAELPENEAEIVFAVLKVAKALKVLVLDRAVSSYRIAMGNLRALPIIVRASGSKGIGRIPYPPAERG